MRNYKHLTLEQRYQIAALLRERLSCNQIARNLGVASSTISREIRRNIGTYLYAPKVAHRLALDRRSDKSWRRIAPSAWQLVRSLLQEFQWSPQQISGWLKRVFAIAISHEWIYQFVLRDKANGGDLHKHLRCRKKRRCRYGTYEKRSPIPDRVGIEERPAEAEARESIGHWEADTIIGKGRKSAIVTLVERRSRRTWMRRVARKNASEVAHAMIRLLESVRAKVASITCDNGTEFAHHRRVSASLKAAVFFADPYSSWQRGTNENTNGLIRQYLPKGTDFREISDQEIETIMNKLNNRPRKTLGYRTPNEVFFEESKSGALQS